jgi:hypothetical protein
MAHMLTAFGAGLGGRLGPTPRVGLELRELMLVRRAEENLMETDHSRSPVALGTGLVADPVFVLCNELAVRSG